MLRGDAGENSVYFIGFYVSVLGTRGMYIVTTKSKVVQIYAMKSYRRNGGMPPLILNLGTGWRCVAGLMPRPL
jgi:hypothetical protein